MHYSLEEDCPTFRQTRLERINRLGERILRRRDHKMIEHEVPKQQPRPVSTNQLILQMLWCDKQLGKCINLFPCQLVELQRELPEKSLRPTLKLLNTIMSSSEKEIKNDDNEWKQQAIYFLIQANNLWKMRWSIPEYCAIVQTADPIAINPIIDQAIRYYGIHNEPGLGRAIVLRYLMDIDQ